MSAADFWSWAGTGDPSRREPLYRPEDPDSFNNADDWFDDTSDGPVTAEVIIDGRRIPVDGACGRCRRRTMHPTLSARRTMTDLLIDLYVETGWLPKPETASRAADTAIAAVLVREPAGSSVPAGTRPTTPTSRLSFAP